MEADHGVARRGHEGRLDQLEQGAGHALPIQNQLCTEEPVAAASHKAQAVSAGHTSTTHAAFSLSGKYATVQLHKGASRCSMNQ